MVVTVIIGVLRIADISSKVDAEWARNVHGSTSKDKIEPKFFLKKKDLSERSKKYDCSV